MSVAYDASMEGRSANVTWSCCSRSSRTTVTSTTSPGLVPEEQFREGVVLTDHVLGNRRDNVVLLDSSPGGRRVWPDRHGTASMVNPLADTSQWYARSVRYARVAGLRCLLLGTGPVLTPSSAAALDGATAALYDAPCDQLNREAKNGNAVGCGAREGAPPGSSRGPFSR